RWIGRRLWNRWARRAYLAGLLVLAVAAGWLAWDRSATRKKGEQRLAGVVADLDREDPGWTLEPVWAARKRPAPSPNSMAIILDVAREPSEPFIIVPDIDNAWFADAN